MSYLLPTVTTKEGVDELILNSIDTVLVLRAGRATNAVCLQLDDILAKAVREVSKFAKIALVDVDSKEIQMYVRYFDITLIPATLFLEATLNAEHMKMDSGTPDHTKWIGAFHCKQDFIDVVETINRGAMKGKLIVTCPLPPQRILPSDCPSDFFTELQGRKVSFRVKYQFLSVGPFRVNGMGRTNRSEANNIRMWKATSGFPFASEPTCTEFLLQVSEQLRNCESKGNNFAT